MRSRTVRRLSWCLALLLLPAACSKTRPGRPAARGGPALTGAPADARPVVPAVEVHGAADAGHSGPAAGPVEDLLASLRPGVRPGIARAIGVGNVGELSFYDIDLRLDPDAGTFEARERLDFHNRTADPLDRVVLRVYGNEFGREGEGPPVTLRSVEVAGAAAAVEHPGPTTYVVPLPAPLPPGRRVVLDVEFSGAAPRQEPGQTGLLRQGLEMIQSLLGGGRGGIEGYGILSMGDGIVSLAAWYPVLARYFADERRWDTAEPTGIGDVGTEDLANYRVRVRVPGPATVASSGVELARGATPTDVTFGGVALRDFTVLASRTYAVLERTVGETTVRAYVPQGREPFARRILDHAVAALEVYERRFGPYPLTELDVAAAPLLGGAGGVEFPGLVTVATMLLQDLSESFGAWLPAGLNRPPVLDEMVEFVVVHEVAHQWWNGLVGSDSVRHPFLDEGMAQYSSVLYFEDRYGSERAARAADRNVKINYHVYRLLGGADGTVDRPTGDFSGPLEYTALVYGKGPYFWAAVRERIGDEAFDRVLHAYSERYAYRVAEPDAFARLAGELTGRTDELLALHRRWFHEAHGDEDLGTADLGQILQLVLGDTAVAGDLAEVLQGLGGIEGLSGLLRMLQGSGGADGGSGGDQGLAVLMQMLQAGAADGGAPPGTPLLPGAGDAGIDAAGPLGELGPLFEMTRALLQPLAADDPDIARLLDLLDRVLRGEDVSLVELLPLLLRTLETLRSTYGLDGPDAGVDPSLLLRMQPMAGGGTAARPSGRTQPDAGLRP